MPRLAWQSNEAILFYFIQNSISRLQFVTSVRKAGLSGLLFPISIPSSLFSDNPVYWHSQNLSDTTEYDLKNDCVRDVIFLFSSVCILEEDTVQFSSVAQLYLTLCDSMDYSTPGFPVHQQLLEFAQTHVH